MENPSYSNCPVSLLESSPDPFATSRGPEQHREYECDRDPTLLPYTAVSKSLSESRSTTSPLHSELHQKSPGRPFWHVMKMSAEMALLPLFAIAYLAFCYTIHGEIVPVNTFGLYAVSPQHLPTIKGGITAISILVVTIALYPIHDIVATLKSEEFFRVLSCRNQGVPLETVNNISTPTFGYVRMMVSVWKNMCSKYYILGIVASLFAFIVSTLAPGALTIETVLSDGELMAFDVGAVPEQSVLNASYDGGQSSYTIFMTADSSASFMMAEVGLGVQYSFGIAGPSEYAAYIVPGPRNLDTTMVARWLTDVIGLNPTCSWAATNLTKTILPISSNSMNRTNIVVLATAFLVDFGSDVQVRMEDLSSDGKPFANFKDSQGGQVANHSTQATTSDGSMIFLLGQCQSGTGCAGSMGYGNLTLDLSGANNTFTLELDDQVWTLAVLACIPNITIETREVRNDGHGTLTVQPRPASGPLTRQGNLNIPQTRALFSISIISVVQDPGLVPSIQYSAPGVQEQEQYASYGSDLYNSLIGSDSSTGTNATLTPPPIDHITQRYIEILQSTAKPYLAGYLGTAYVPGRISSNEIVFAAAIPNLVISTAVFALLAGVIILAHFRPRERIEFTFANVAAAVHGSQLPAQFAQVKTGHTDADTEGDAGQNGTGEIPVAESSTAFENQYLVEVMSDRRVLMERRADGSPVLHMG